MKIQAGESTPLRTFVTESLSEEKRRGRLAIRLKVKGLALAAPTNRCVFLLLPAAHGRVP